MSREGRTLLLLGVFALGAVAVLGSMAKRYGAMLDDRSSVASEHARPEHLSPIDDAPGAIDGFVEVRSAMQRALEQRVAGATVETTLVEARDRALVAQGLELERYEAVRAVYRRWRIGAPLDDELSGLFASRAQRLRAADLGAYESLDR